MSTFESFIFELVVFAVLVFDITYYFVGSTKNKQIARKWIEIHRDIIEPEFAKCGDNEGHLLLKDGPKDYVFYASGRSDLEYCQIILSLAPRHDLVLHLLHYLSTSINDKMVKVVN